MPIMPVQRKMRRKKKKEHVYFPTIPVCFLPESSTLSCVYLERTPTNGNTPVILFFHLGGDLHFSVSVFVVCETYLPAPIYFVFCFKTLCIRKFRQMIQIHEMQSICQESSLLGSTGKWGPQRHDVTGIQVTRNTRIGPASRTRLPNTSTEGGGFWSWREAQLHRGQSKKKEKERKREVTNYGSQN